MSGAGIAELSVFLDNMPLLHSPYILNIRLLVQVKVQKTFRNNVEVVREEEVGHRDSPETKTLKQIYYKYKSIIK